MALHTLWLRNTLLLLVKILILYYDNLCFDFRNYVVIFKIITKKNTDNILDLFRNRYKTLL